MPGMDVAAHVALGNLPAFRRGLGIDWKSVRRRSREISDETGLRMAAPRREMASLSGGNIQRVVLGRAFSADHCRRARRGVPEPRPRHRHHPTHPGAAARTQRRPAPASSSSPRTSTS